MLIAITDLLKGLRANDRKILAQAITLLESTKKEDEKISEELLNTINSEIAINDPIRLGICGSPGAGKSTLIESLGQVALKDDPNNQIGILAYDPSSQITGGSLLGDKTRMNLLSKHPRCFIRASPSGPDCSINIRAFDIMQLLAFSGFDVVILETVGSGQADVMIRELVDVLIYIMAPNSGDWLQGMKRGITELADIILLTKTDLVDSTREWETITRMYNQSQLLLKVSAIKGDGLDNLWKSILKIFYTKSVSC